MLAHDEEGFFLVPAVLQPFESDVGDDVRCISSDFLYTVGGVHCGIVVRALSLQHLPEIKAGWVALEVPFPDHGGLITLLLQKFGECLLLAVKSLTIGELSVQVAVFSGQNYRPAWSTY